MTAGRRFLVTGVGRGLGAALAARLVGDGHAVWGSTRTGSVDPDPGLAGCVAIDLADEASITAGATALRERTGALDVLVNCAGTDARAFGAPDARRGPFDVDGAAFDAVMRVNVTGPLLLTRAVLPLLRAGRDPMIVNVTSQLGSMEVGSRMGRDVAYGASKAALNLVSLRTAAALRDERIAVVLIHPGWVRTDMGGDAAALGVEESAGAIVDTIGRLSFADTGRFLRWDGSEHPW